MKAIKTTEAAGHVLCHDITQIVIGETKDARFRKGHIVAEADIPVLLSMGKEHLYVWEKREGMLHENEAAELLRTICQNAHMSALPVKEGKIELIAQADGVLKVDAARLERVNAQGEMIIAARHNNTPVKRGDKLAGMRVIPLVIAEEKMRAARLAAGQTPLLTLMPYKQWKVGVIATGGEIFHGRIEDTFTPVVEAKLAAFGLSVESKRVMDDAPAPIAAAIREMIDSGMNMVICTGGMSVDPDDKTPAAIRMTGAEIVTYGVPVLPGAMFLLAYCDGNIPVMGLPGCVMYAKTTVFDLLLPRVLTGEKIERSDLARLGHGGLCLNCPVCAFPACAFGKGG